MKRRRATLVRALFTASFSLFAPALGAQPTPESERWPEEAAALARRGEFFTAATALERPALALGEHPALAPTRTALAQLLAAVPVRAALGDTEGPARDAELALTLAERVPALRSEAYAVVEAVGSACETRASRLRTSTGYLECQALYARVLDRLGPSAPMDVRVRAQVALGRTTTALGDAPAAHAHHRAAIETYRRETHEPGPPDVALEGVEPFLAARAREARRQERIARAREAADEARCRRNRRDCFGGLTESGLDATNFAPGLVGYVRTQEAELLAGPPADRARAAVVEARFSLAQRSVYRIRAPMPRYAGPPTRRSYDDWAQRVLTPYITERRALLYELYTPQFERVFSMHIGPWEPAALASLAEVYYEFAQLIRTAEPPPDMHRAPDLLDGYGVMRDEFTQQLVDFAKAGFLACIRSATEDHAAEPLAQCEADLASIDRRQYPLPDEFVPDPLATR